MYFYLSLYLLKRENENHLYKYNRTGTILKTNNALVVPLAFQRVVITNRQVTDARCLVFSTIKTDNRRVDP